MRFGANSHRLQHLAIREGPDRAGGSTEEREARVGQCVDGRHDPPAVGNGVSVAREAFVLVSTTDGAMILDQDLALIGNTHTNSEVSTKI